MRGLPHAANVEHVTDDYIRSSMLGSELTQCDRKIRSIAMEGHARLVEFIREQLIRLGRKNASALASSITSTLVGAVTLSNIANEESEARRILMSAKISLKEQICSED